MKVEIKIKKNGFVSQTVVEMDAQKGIVYLADWVRNTIDKCEVVQEYENSYKLLRPRPQMYSHYRKESDQMACLLTYYEALNWLKNRRLKAIEALKAQIEKHEKKLTDVVRYYE
jgi:hypothetical protein